MKIAQEYNVSQTVISYINLGKEYFHKDWNYPIVKRQRKIFICERCGKEISKGSKYCIECLNLIKRKVERPSRDELKKLIRDKPFTQIGKIFGVEDSTIRKWCVSENLPSKK